MRLVCRLTSGTSGLNKLVPFPEEHLANFRTFTNHASFHAIHLLGAYDLMQGRVLLTSGRPIKEVTDNGLTIGFGSGLAAAKPSRMARALVLPSLETLSLADWRQKLDAMVTESLHEDVRMFTGMPNAVMPLLHTLVARAEKQITVQLSGGCSHNGAVTARVSYQYRPELPLSPLSGGGLTITASAQAMLQTVQ